MDNIQRDRAAGSYVAGVLRMPSAAAPQRRCRSRAAVTTRGARLLRGFTLVELLVVISIIGVLISLLLPAVQAAREAARRVQCSNNLRQLGLAVHNYQLAHKVLPPGGIVEEKKSWGIWNGQFDPQSGKMFSWIVLILPYFEEGTLYDQFDFDVSVLDQPNEPQATQIDTLLCPSEEAAGRLFVDNTLTNGKSFAKGNYAAWVSPFHVDLQVVVPGALGGGGQPFSRFQDGVSHTLMLSEVRTREHQQDQRGAWALPWTASTLLAFDMHSPLSKTGYYKPTLNSKGIPISLGLTQRPNQGDVEYSGTSLAGGNIDVLYQCPEPNAAQLDGMPCGEYATDAWLSAAPRSLHPGGVNVVFADGHSAFLLNEVDEQVMAYLISISDGQSPSYDDYVR